MYGKIIEELEHDRTAPLRKTTPEKHMNASVHIPDYNVCIMLFNDDYHSVEVALTDKETGQEFCRHVFDRMDTLNAFISQAFAPPEDGEVCERREGDLRIIEHKM